MSFLELKMALELAEDCPWPVLFSTSPSSPPPPPRRPPRCLAPPPGRWRGGGNYEIMLIDSAPGTGCPVIASLQDSNFAILITEPTRSGFTDLKRVLEVVNHFNIPYGVVINKWDINKNLSQKIEKWAKEKFSGKISYDKKIFEAIANLTPIMKTNLRAKQEITEVYNKLKNDFEF